MLIIKKLERWIKLYKQRIIIQIETLGVKIVDIWHVNVLDMFLSFKCSVPIY